MAAKKKRRKRVPAKRKNLGGRPPFVPTKDQRQQVEMMVAYGLTYEQTASLTINPKTGKGISTRTLQDKFKTELASGGAKAHALVAQSLFKKATSDSHPNAVTAAIWWTKARMGWRGEEKHVHEVQGSTGVLVAPATLTPEEWIEAQRKREAKSEKKPQG